MNLQPYKVGDMESGAPIPEATYRYRIAKVEYGDPNDSAWKAAHPNSQAKGPHLTMDLVVIDEGEYLGRHVFSTLTFAKGKDFALRQVCDALGKEEDWMLIDEQGVPHWDEFVDCEVLGVTTISTPTEAYPNPRNNIKKFSAAI
jgi:hypothetical protein